MASMIRPAATYKLLYVHGGSLTVRYANRFLLVPDKFGLLISTSEKHTEQLTHGTVVQYVSLYTVAVPHHPAYAVGISPSPLALALIDHVADLPETSTERQHAEAVIVDLLVPAPSAYEVTLPTDSRLLRAAEAVLRDPVGPHPTAHSAALADLPPGTFSRLFETQTGVFWADWCFVIKMFHAMKLLNQGSAVGEVSHLVGYKTPSTFTIAFTRYFGVAPSSARPYTACKWCGHLKFRRPRPVN